MDHNPDSQQPRSSHEHKAHLTVKQSCEQKSRRCDHTDQPSHTCEDCPNLKDRLMAQTLKEVFGIENQ